MTFVSVFEQEILDQKQKILDQKQKILDQKQQLLAKEQQLLDQKQQLVAKEQESRVNCLRGIALGLKLKFQKEGEALFAEVQKQTDLGWLRHFLDSIEAASACDELRKLLP